MPEKKPDIKTFMTPQRIKEVKSEVAELERMLLSDAAGKHIQDPGEVKREISKKKKMLTEFTPQKLTGQKANKAYAWARKFEVWFKEHQLPNKALHQSYPKGNDVSVDFEQAVQEQTRIMGNPRIQEAIRTYKHIMRRIDPENPMITNIERLRR